MNNIIFQNSYLRNNCHNTGLDMHNKLEMMRIFCVASESRNFKEAATQLGISPQAVTRAIKELEEQRGEILFYRSTRQIKIPLMVSVWQSKHVLRWDRSMLCS